MRILLIVFWLVAAAAPAASQTLLRSETPDWVMPIDLPTMSPDLYRHVQGGENFLLIDRQIRWIGSVRETYIRIATEAVNRSGLESVATVSRDFDPNIDDLTMVRLDVVRNGIRTAIGDAVVPDIIRRETRLEQGILDGSLTAHISVPGVQVGDIVDAAFVWRSQEYFPGANFSGRYQMEYSVPVALSRVIVDWPNKRSFDYQNMDGAGEPEITALGTATRYKWVAADIPPRYIDDDTPAEYDPWVAAEFSGFQNWSQVSASLTDYYTADQTVPPSWRAKVDLIAQTHTNPADRAFAALRLVQDEIRYVGIEVGAGGYFARDPETVVANAFGDCKDKSLLLKTILSDLGIRSGVALASLDAGYGVINRLPSTHPFDHMIVGAELDGKTVWMDPTAGYQGGSAQTATPPDYGYVLPLTKNNSGLVEISANSVHRYSRDMTETFRFTLAGAFLTVTTEFSGEGADAQRDNWAVTPANDIATSYLAYYARNYPGIREAAPIVMTDDRDANVITVVETYLIPRAKLMELDLISEFPFVSGNSYDDFPEMLLGERRDPLAVSHNQRLVHKIQIRNAPIEFEAPRVKPVGSPAFDQSFTAKAWPGGNMDMTWDYQSRARSISANDVAQVVKDANFVREHSAFSWDMRPDE